MNLNNWLKYILILCVLVIASCDGNKSKTTTVEDVLEREGLTRESDIEIDTESIGAMHTAATAILEFRYKEMGKDPVAAIEMDRWYYEFIYEGGEIERAKNEKWIDFYPDLTYEYGDNSGVKGKGKYHYSISKGLLLIVDNNSSVKPAEFEVKLSGPVMVLVGRTTYKDNHIQMKLQQDNIRPYQ